MMPNGVYRALEVVADNYLYPMYAYHDGDSYVVSTSVYELIKHKGRFVRNPRFQTTYFFRPTFMTIDREIMRVRTQHRRSTYELTDAEEIMKLGVDLMQNYITEIEDAYPGYVHILFMGGKDSQNIILAKRKSPWIVLSGEPNASINREFIENNNIDIERFVAPANDTNDTLLLEEIMGSDCFYDTAHFRWVNVVKGLVDEHNGKTVIWIGTSGDVVFSKSYFLRYVDYYAAHDLYVGMGMGILHQVVKNILDVPVVSPYQSQRFLDDLFYRFDPYFVEQAGDVRAKMGEMLLGRSIKYPNTNPGPKPWARNRSQSIPIYIAHLKKMGVVCQENVFQSFIYKTYERMAFWFASHTDKRRTRLSKFLFPARQLISKLFPALRNKRHDMAAKEIK